MNEEYKLHAAIFNSLRTLEVLGASKELVFNIEGSYSRKLQNTEKKTKSRFINCTMVSIAEMVRIRWKCDCVQNAVTVEQLLADLYKSDGIPDVILTHITFAIPYTFFSNYSYENQTSYLEWVFTPYTFHKGVWRRLKALEFPAQKLYTRYSLLRQEMLKTMNKETAKRWRDTLMMNKPNPNLGNQDIRNIWGNKKWALLLKESRGNFDLMNMNEI